MISQIFANQNVQEFIVELVAMLVVAATPLLIRWFRAHGVNISAAQEQRILAFAPVAVEGVEEYVRQAAKNGYSLGSGEKLDLAVKQLRTMAVDGFKSYADDKLKTVLEAHLPAMRVKLSSPPPLQVDIKP